jgi:hypothetical protein
MSHFTTIKTQIKDLAALEAAAGELGLTLAGPGDARGYYADKPHKGERVIVLKGPYDIAVNRQADGTFGLTTDWWEGEVEKEVGENYGRLLQLYAVHKATAEARRKGHFVQRSEQRGGFIKLTIATS